MQMLYFGWVRQRIGLPTETVAPPDDVRDVAGLIDWLSGRSDAYAEALRNREALRVAVNQELCEFDAPVGSGDEVALFPPMTGG